MVENIGYTLGKSRKKRAMNLATAWLVHGNFGRQWRHLTEETDREATCESLHLPSGSRCVLLQCITPTTRNQWLHNDVGVMETPRPNTSSNPMHDSWAAHH